MGVKKILIAGAALAALLSSCVSTGLITVFSDDIVFTSNYVESRSGSQVPAICDNKGDTLVTLEFRFSGDISNFESFQANLFGRTAARDTYRSPTFQLNPPSAGVTVTGQRIKVVFGFATRTVPYQNPNMTLQGIMPQAVVVNPVPGPNPLPNPPIKIGALDLRLKITDARGDSSSSNALVEAIPVWDNCQ